MRKIKFVLTVLIALIFLFAISCGSPKKSENPDSKTPAPSEKTDTATEANENTPSTEGADAQETTGDVTENLESGDPVIGSEYVHDSNRGKCLNCHNLGGEGKPDGFKLDDVGLRRDPKWLAEFIQNPRSLRPEVARMPPWRGDSTATIADVVAYLMTLKTKVDHPQSPDKKPAGEPSRYTGEMGGWPGHGGG
ncbi:MAG: c-type cytochrome [bacterium]